MSFLMPRASVLSGLFLATALTLSGQHSHIPPAPSASTKIEFDAPRSLRKFYQAVHAGDMPAVTKELKKNPEAARAENSRALVIAAGAGHLPVVKLLMDRGAQIRNGISSTLGQAVNSGNADVVDYLIEHGADSRHDNDRYLIAAAMGDNVRIVKRLLDLGANIDAVDRSDDSPMSGAAKHGSTEVLAYLVERGGNPRERNDYPLREAASHNHPENVLFLLQRGADVHAGNDEALRLAAVEGYTDVVKILLAHGARAQAIDHDIMAQIRLKFPETAKVVDVALMTAPSSPVLRP